MKLVIAGASGFVGTELIRQSLSHPGVSFVIALARREVAIPSDLSSTSDRSKFRSVIVEDYGAFNNDVGEELAGADACIWTVAITPSKSKNIPFEQVKKICQTDALAGLQAMYQASRAREGNAKPFSFIYMSGAAAERDQSKKPKWMPEYCLMRGEAENILLEFAAQKKGSCEVSIAKPGLITAPGQYLKSMGATALKYTTGLPSVGVRDVAAAMIRETVEGSSKETLENDDLVKLGTGVSG